jgi:hypothetical protein
MLPTAPMPMSRETLCQTVVAWRDGRLFSLADFVASRRPQTTTIARLAVEFELDEWHHEWPVPVVQEMEETERFELAQEIFSRMDSRSACAIGGRSFAKSEIVAEMAARTPVGRQSMQRTIQHISLVERIALAGLIRRVDTMPGDAIGLPNLPF